MRFVVIWLTLCLTIGPVSAKDIFVAPQNAASGTEADGSSTKPWPSLEAAFAKGSPVGGDRILLLPGHHGALSLKSYRYDPPLTMMSATADRAHLDHIRIEFGKGLVIRDINVWPRQPSALRAVVFTDDHSEDIHFSNLQIMSRPKADRSYFDWTIADWLGPMRNHGIRMNGPRNRAEGNTLYGVDFAITTSGQGARIVGNRVFGFSGDAMRSLGDDSVVSGNHVENCFAVNDNHDDGFQAWAPRGKAAAQRQGLVGLEISNNMILEWAGPSGHPLRCTLQGIGLFDGPYQDLKITNNVVSVASYHGISVYGGMDVSIVHNTVVNSYPDSSETFPWIRVDDRKSGEPARRVTVTNNLSMGFSNASSANLPAFRLSNAHVVRPSAMFADAGAQNYALRSDSPAIDAGQALSIPSFDIVGQNRSLGAAPDLGAFEMR